MNVISSQNQTLAKLLDAAAIRQRVIGQNIANVNTPGYERREVLFEQELAELLTGTDVGPLDLSKLTPTVVATEGLPKRTDGNNVNMEMEIGQLTKNQILFQTFTQILATDMSMIRTAITGQ